MDQVRARVAELLAQVEDSPLGRVALVTHGACIRALLQHTTGSRIDLSGHVYDNGNCAPTAGVWRGTRADDRWTWELAFRPALGESATNTIEHA
jgi:2,3-bisphosphoglycerate-dependent phosphoglycerate mutase